ncbi:hypothetical protein KC315_g185 [Hortaea werneckii]|nr:hypothetical protein KC315_g185 [Hortaea werneckii]
MEAFDVYWAHQASLPLPTPPLASSNRNQTLERQIEGDEGREEGEGGGEGEEGEDGEGDGQEKCGACTHPFIEELGRENEHLRAHLKKDQLYLKQLIFYGLELSNKLLEERANHAREVAALKEAHLAEIKEAYCRMPAQAVPKRAGEGMSPPTSPEKRACLSDVASQHAIRARNHTEIDTAPTTSLDGVAPELLPEVEASVETSRKNSSTTKTLKGKSLDEALPSKNCVTQRSKGASSNGICLLPRRSQAPREGAHGDQTDSTAVPSWFRQLALQNVQGMLDQASASYNISEAQAIANLREKRCFSDDDEDNIIFRLPGKTIMCVAHILNDTEYWLQQPEDLQEHRPTLIVCPNNIAKKWTKTVRNAADERWQVWRYGQNASKKDTVRTCTLDRHKTFTTGPRSIVIMTMQELSNISAEEVPHPFGQVCVDESQGFRHALRTKKGAALICFCARFRHCYTATICYDSLHDINGHLAFLERALWTENRDCNTYKHGNPRFGENVLCTEAHSNGPEYEDNQSKPGSDRTRRGRGTRRIARPSPFNPFNTFSALNRNIVQCATVRAFSYYIVPFIDRALKGPRAKEDISVAADRVKKIFDLLVLARGYSTTVVDRNGNTVRCGEGIPPATTATVDLRFSEEEQAEYRRREQDAGCRLKWQELIRDLHLEKTAGNLDDVDLSASARPKTPPKFATRRGRAIAHGRKYAFMTTLPSHLGMTAFKGLSLAWFRSRRDWSLAQLVQFMKDKGALNPADRNTPLDTPEEVVRQFLWGAPKFRYALREAERVLFTDAKPVGHRKLADFCQSPKTQELLLKLYEYVGIRCLCIDSSVTASMREEMIEDFNTKDDHQILLTTYTINIAGQDLHPKCCISLFMECAYGWAAEHQAGCRISRFGQEHDVEITRLFVRDTYNEVQEYRILAKAAPYFESQSSNLLEEIRTNAGNNKIDGYSLVAKFMGMARTRIKSARREDRSSMRRRLIGAGVKGGWKRMRMRMSNVAMPWYVRRMGMGTEFWYVWRREMGTGISIGYRQMHTKDASSDHTFHQGMTAVMR